MKEQFESKSQHMTNIGEAIKTVIKDNERTI